MSGHRGSRGRRRTGRAEGSLAPATRSGGWLPSGRQLHDWLGCALFTLIFVGGVFTFGYAGEDRARALCWMLCGLLAVWGGFRWATGRFRVRGRSATAAVFALLLGTVAWSGLQLVPLPMDVTARVSPYWAEAVEALERAGYDPPGRAPLSVRPESGLRGWNQMVASVLFLVGACALASRRRGFYFLAGLVAVASVSEALLGIWTYVLSDARRTNGFIFNPNHHAAFIMAGLPIAAWWVRSRAKAEEEGFDYDRRRDWIIFLAIVVLLAFVGWLLSLSRGALIALVAVGCGDLAFRAFQSFRRSSLGYNSNNNQTGFLGLDIWVVWWATVAGAGLLFASGVFGLISERMERTDSIGSRTAVWSATWQGFTDAPVVGLGLGGADAAINRYLADRPSEVRQVWSHNDYVQMLADFGAVWTVFAIGMGAVIVMRVGREARKNVKRLPANVREIKGAAAGGLLVVLVHAFFDFHLRVPLVGFQALILAALVLTRPGGRVAIRSSQMDWRQ